MTNASLAPVPSTPLDARLCRTLVVEDDRSSRLALVQVLKLSGFEVESAKTLAEAMAKLNGWLPECIVLDLMLPDGDGSAVLAEIRARQLSIRVAVVTASSDADLLCNTAKLRPEAMFTKPIDLSALLAWLKSASA
jgi:two-component system, LuxR family, response regulator FixJ